MKKMIAVLAALVALACMVNTAVAAGYDQWGRNSTAHLFNGWYVNNYAGRPGYYPGPEGNPYVGVIGDPCGNIATYFLNTACDPATGAPTGPYWYAYNVWLVMKWNEAWDEGNLGTWTPDAWITNHMTGWYLGDDGKVHQWEYFVKIVWVGPGGEGSAYWREGGYVIWGEFEAIMEVYNDPYGGYHGLGFHTNPAGFGAA